MATRVVITGVGLKTALGPDTQTTWQNLLSGTCGLEPFWIDSMGVAVGWAKGLEGSPGDDPKIMSLALSASREALENAGFDTSENPCACIAGLGKPDLGPWGGVSPATTLSSYLQDDLSMVVAGRLGLQGPAMAVSAACATGAIAIGLGSEWIRDGRANAVLVVCSDVPIHPLYMAGFQQMGVLAPLEKIASHSVRPFDRQRTGFGLGEGAAALLLEEESSALRRGARPWARLSGFSQRSLRAHPVRFDGEGASIAGALEQAMAQAGCRPDQVGYLNCHGTATLLNDALETQAIKKAFGPAARDVSFSSTKASTGHLLAATGAVEAAFAILSSRDGQIPPTLNLEDPDPACDLDFTPLKSRSRPVQNAMSLSFGFGGAVGALVFSRC